MSDVELFRVWRPKERVQGAVACPECCYLSTDDYCGRCGSYLHPDHIQWRKDEQFKEWAAKLQSELESPATVLQETHE